MNFWKEIKQNKHKTTNENNSIIVTGDIGEIIEEDNKIICIVSQDKLNKWYNTNENKLLKLNGINSNKQVYYIFDNITIPFALKISSEYKANITFKNCYFKSYINIILLDGEINFISNVYDYKNNHGYLFERLFTGNDINKIVFKNEIFKSQDVSLKLNNYGININAKEIKFINSEIEVNNPGFCFIKSNKLDLDETNIKCDELYISANTITSKNSIIDSNEIYIQNANKDKIANVYGNVVVYNNNTLIDSNSKEIVNINLETEKDKLKLELLEILKNLKQQCEQVKKQELEELEQNINNRGITKLLHK